MAGLNAIIQNPKNKYNPTQFSKPEHWIPHPRYNPALRMLRNLAFFFVRRQRAYSFFSETPSFTAPQGSASYSLKLFNGPSTTPDMVSKSLKPRSGEILAVLFQGSRLLAYARITQQSATCQATKVRIHLKPGQLHIYELGVSRNYSPREILPFFLSAVGRKLHLSDYNHIFIASDVKNILLLHCIRKAGFIPSLYITRYFLMGMESFRTVKKFYQKIEQNKGGQQPNARLRETASSQSQQNGYAKSVVE